MQHHSKPAPDVPKWSALLVEAVNKPGMIMEAYSAFHNYSIGNQILALVQCQFRGLEPGPINTFPRWKELGRIVKGGERRECRVSGDQNLFVSTRSRRVSGKGQQSRVLKSSTFFNTKVGVPSA